MTPRRPSVLLVVLDCVRQQDFGASLDMAPVTQAFRHISKSAKVYTHAVAPSTWTIPSHASIFTGLEPWQHQCHARGDLRLSTALETVAERFARAGYYTACLSANPWISDITGLSRGFGVAVRGRAGSWLGHRIPGAERGQSPFQPTPDGEDQQQIAQWRSSVLGFSELIARRYPGLLDVARRVVRGVEGGAHTHMPHCADWIEPVFQGLVKRLESDESFFFFVNFLDAHEPFLLDSEVPIGAKNWLKYYSVAQGAVFYKTGSRSVPSPQTLAPIHRNYLHRIQGLDERMGRLESILRKADRWNDTMVVITSDHGQAFGECNQMFHQEFPLPQLARVPLIIRPPGGLATIEVDHQWTSLTQIHPLILSTVDPEYVKPAPSAVTDERTNPEGPQTAFSCSDGILRDFRTSFMLSPAEIQRGDVASSAAYCNDVCIFLTEDMARVRYLDASSGEPIPGDSRRVSDIPESTSLSLEKIVGLMSRDSRHDFPDRIIRNREVQHRLETWGY